MTPRTHVHLEGTVEVPLTQPDAFELFTPNGERRWVQGWDRSFPAPIHDQTAPGTVFQTTHHDVVTWIVVASDRPRSIAYCNVSRSDRAALIRVSCQPNDDGTTTAHVVHDMTALSDEGDASVNEFAARDEQYMTHWQDAIAAALAASSPH